METPRLDHITAEEFEHVYEPAEDSFLLLDALESELGELRRRDPALCLELGAGSGVVVAALARALPRCHCVCTDVNPRAAALARRTAAANGVRVDALLGAGAAGLRAAFDLVVCNPPYVPTERAGGAGLAASWAGGRRGREVIDRLLPAARAALAPGGVFYLLLEAANEPAEVARLMAAAGWRARTVLRRAVRNERLQVVKFYR